MKIAQKYEIIRRLLGIKKTISNNAVVVLRFENISPPSINSVSAQDDRAIRLRGIIRKNTPTFSRMEPACPSVVRRRPALLKMQTLRR